MHPSASAGKPPLLPSSVNRAKSTHNPDSRAVVVAKGTNPDSSAAVVFGQSIIRYCSDGKLNPNGEFNLNKEQLSSLLDRVINYIEDQTGVLPSVVSGTAANKPASNNPTDPDLWDWNRWESGLGIKDMPHRHRSVICLILGANIGRDEGKILALFRHPIFEDSLRNAKIPTNTLESLHVRNFIQLKECSSIFDKVLDFYGDQGDIKPAGIIKSAIALGYLPRVDIERLVQVGRR
ncbi:hypothetical protein [Endozoicomonas acroporae]|uniref:hypothetical protein n=1 Tax=Endozoicomonas acroporae TaxID=1701104 RepID=UPI0013D12BF9|nr:hypothetical protein [Endozoicomonas acroporae]